MSKVKRSIALDKNKIVLEILNSYEEITIIEQQDEIIFFKIKGKEYGCYYLETELDTFSPVILVKNDVEYDYPHILPTSIPIDEEMADKYRYVCLNENDSTIPFLQSFEEKITDTIERLIYLLSLSDIEKEEEFQKEFLFYWNGATQYPNMFSLYIGRERIYQKLNAYKNDIGDIRFVANGIYLNDSDKKNNGNKKWKHLPELPVFYIPITDKRRVVPPTRDKEWTAEDIIRIVYGKQYNRISHDCYVKLGQVKVKTRCIGIVFEMEVNGNTIDFTAIIKFKNTNNDILLNKLKKEIIEVIPIKSKRVDYYHLCKQIGNETTLLDKNVLLIGAGSLGSYVAKELVRTGVRRITLYDKETLVEENVLRHSIGNYGVGFPKVLVLKCELERIHPEIHIEAVENDIDKNSLAVEMDKVDLIVFAVGSSTVQWELNKVLKEKKCKARVIYTWLEAGGENSHILSIDYNKLGCFQCLFTNKKGELVNNKANKLSETEVDAHKIRNGCGGTRVAYGNSVLLRTTSVLLDVIKKDLGVKENKNRLINISPTTVIDDQDTFVEGKCRCCGNGKL